MDLNCLALYINGTATAGEEIKYHSGLSSLCQRPQVLTNISVFFFLTHSSITFPSLHCSKKPHKFYDGVIHCSIHNIMLQPAHAAPSPISRSVLWDHMVFMPSPRPWTSDPLPGFGKPIKYPPIHKSLALHIPLTPDSTHVPGQVKKNLLVPELGLS